MRIGAVSEAPVYSKRIGDRITLMRRKLCLLLAVVLMLAAGCTSKEKEKLELRNLGISQMDAGDYTGAIQSFQQALEASDGLVGEFELDVLMYRAEAQLKTGAYEDAAYTYNVLSQVDEEKTEYRIREFIAYTLDGQLDAALETYEKVCELGGSGQEFDQGFLLLGDELEKAGRGQDAMAIYQAAVHDGSRNGELYNRMAMVELENGDYDRAMEYLKQGLSTNDAAARGRLLYNQVVVYEKQLDFAGALAALEQYAAEFGVTPEIEKELAFLRTR